MPTLAIYGLAGLAMLTAGFLGGWEVRGWRDDSAQLVVQKAQTQAIAQAAANARSEQQAADQIGFTVGQNVANAETKIQTTTVARIQEIPVVYITPRASSACTVNLGAQRLFNLNASGRADTDPTFSVPPGATDDSPTTTSLAALAATVVENYGLDRQCRARLDGWNDWAGKVKAAWAELAARNGKK